MPQSIVNDIDSGTVEPSHRRRVEESPCHINIYFLGEREARDVSEYVTF